MKEVKRQTKTTSDGRTFVKLPGLHEAWIEANKVIAVRYGFAENGQTPMSVVVCTEQMPLAIAPTEKQSLSALLTEILEVL